MTSRIFTRIAAFSLFTAAVAFVALEPPSRFWLGKSDTKSKTNKSSQMRAQFLRNKLALPGAERDGGPTAAAEQEYANRAYPAKYVPLSVTLTRERPSRRPKHVGIAISVCGS